MKNHKPPVMSRHQIKIEKSTLTGNYLLILNDIVFDSAISKQDIMKVKDWLVKQLKKNPPKPRQPFESWVKTCNPQPPKTKAYVLVWEKGKCTKKTVYA